MFELVEWMIKEGKGEELMFWDVSLEVLIIVNR